MNNTKTRIMRFLLALVWLPVCGSMILSLLTMWIFPEKYRDHVTEDTVSERQYIPDGKGHLLWQQDSISIDQTPSSQATMFAINEGTLLIHDTAHFKAINVHDGKQIWETAVARPVTVKRYEDLLLVKSFASQYPNAPIRDESLKDCSSFGSTSIAALNINDGTPKWQHKYSGAASHSDILVSNDIIYTFGSDDHGASWSRIGINIQTGQLEQRDCSKWPWEYKSPPGYQPDESQEMITNSIYVFPKREVKVGDYYEDVRAYTDGDTLNIVDDNQKTTTLTFTGEDLQSSQMRLVVIDEVWLVYFQDSNQLFAFEFDESPVFSYLK